MKPWWQSRTILANALAIAVAVAQYYLGIDALPTADPAVVAGVLAAINIGLRLITSSAVRV